MIHAHNLPHTRPLNQARKPWQGAEAPFTVERGRLECAGLHRTNRAIESLDVDHSGAGGRAGAADRFLFSAQAGEPV